MDDLELARRLKPVTTVGRTGVVAAAVRQRRPELELLVRARAATSLISPGTPDSADRSRRRS